MGENIASFWTWLILPCGMISNCIHFCFFKEMWLCSSVWPSKAPLCLPLSLCIDGQSDWFRSLTAVNSAPVSTDLLVVCGTQNDRAESQSSSVSRIPTHTPIGAASGYITAALFSSTSSPALAICPVWGRGAGAASAVLGDCGGELLYTSPLSVLQGTSVHFLLPWLIWFSRC